MMVEPCPKFKFIDLPADPFFLFRGSWKVLFKLPNTKRESLIYSGVLK